MNRLAVAAVAGLIALGVSGCSAVKRATGQLDDTVLPGQRENVLPPDQQTARDPNISGGKSAIANDAPVTCAPDEPNCVGDAPQAQEPPAYQDASAAEEPVPVAPAVKKPIVKKTAAKKPVAKKKKKKPIVKKPVTPEAPATEPAPPAVPDEPSPAVPDASAQPPKL